MAIGWHPAYKVRMQRRLLFALLMGLLSAMACGESRNTGRTIEGRTAIPCSNTEQCPQGWRCRDGTCQENGTSESNGECQSQADCAAGMHCDLTTGTCVSCLIQEHCPVNETCVEGQCVGNICEPGENGDTNNNDGSSDSSEGPLTPTELDLCSELNPCGGGLGCVSLYPGGEKRCSRTCVSNGDCPTDMRCVLAGESGFCVTNDTGRTCSGASSCNAYCYESSTPAYCTHGCTSAADCPNGYGCMPVGANLTRVCVKAEDVCSATDTAACVAPSACDLDDPQLLISSCTLACTNSTDCPQRAQGLAPWSCDNGICRRPGDLYGPQPGGAPIGYVCDGNEMKNVCADGFALNLETQSPVSVPSCPGNGDVNPGAPGDFCLNSCTYQGGCPRAGVFSANLDADLPGMACVGIGSVDPGGGGIRIGLCMPTGIAEVGAACSLNIECRFGYCFNGRCSRDCTDDGVCPGDSQCVAPSGIVLPTIEGKTFKHCE